MNGAEMTQMRISGRCRTGFGVERFVLENTQIQLMVAHNR